jgi:NifU-like protein involved in Fe-S cluster formation
MDEPPLSHSPLGVAYYDRMMETRQHLGRPALFNAAAHVLACPGRSSDHVFVFLRIEGSKVLDAHWQCHLCDPWMQISADIACSLVEGRGTAEILDLTLADFERKLGGPDHVVASHTGAADLVAYKACVDYEVKQAIRSDQNSEIRPKSRMAENGYSGRGGMLRLKRLIESRFAAEGLRIPRARLESVCAEGTIQDLSVLVQDLLEAHAIKRIRANGLGFPRSFDEALAGSAGNKSRSEETGKPVVTEP